MSLDWHERYQPQRPSGWTLRRLTEADLPAAATLSAQSGRAYAAQDFARLLRWTPEGCFCVEEPERGLIGVVTTTLYERALGWVGCLVVAQDRQGGDVERRLVRAALDFLIAAEARCIMAHAAEVPRALYEALGFRVRDRVERWEGRASTYLGPRARRLRAADTDAVLALDAELTRLPRAHILRGLLAEFPELAWVDVQRGEVEGYLLGQRRGPAVHLGPWLSWSAAGAERLLRTALEQLQGQQIMLHMPSNNGRGLILAGNHNLHRTATFMRLLYGDTRPPAAQPLAELAMLSLETG